MSAPKTKPAATATLSIAAKLRSLGPPPWARQVNGLTQTQLVATFAREAALHQDLIMSGAPAPATWRNFRQFMYDVGPCPPGEGYILAVTDDMSRTYDPGKVAWKMADEPGVYYWKTVEGSAAGHWNRPTRQPKAAHDPLADLLRMAPDGGWTPSEESKVWAPTDPKKLAAFTETFNQWRAMVRPEYRGSARAAFLYLYSALITARESRDILKSLELWDRPDAVEEMHAHREWRRYCDQLKRAEMALSEMPEFAKFSPQTQLDQLFIEVESAERRFRGG